MRCAEDICINKRASTGPELERLYGGGRLTVALSRNDMHLLCSRMDGGGVCYKAMVLVRRMIVLPADMLRGSAGFALALILGIKY